VAQPVSLGDTLQDKNANFLWELSFKWELSDEFDRNS
jgi:hypothetical protein